MFDHTRAGRAAQISACVVLILSTAACIGSRGETRLLAADMPLHLEDHLDAATVVGSEVSTDLYQPVEWRFDQPQPDWKSTPLWNPPYGAPSMARSGEALRVTLTDRVRVQVPKGALRGAIHIALPDWKRAEWADVLVRARADSTSAVNLVGLAFNLREGRGTGTPTLPPFQFGGQTSPVVRDGTIQTYRLRVNQGAPSFQGPWRQLFLYFGSDGEPGSIDLLSVTVVPAGAAYADARAGLRSIAVARAYRRSLFTHAPGRVEYRVRVPDGGRLQAALGVLRADVPVEFTIDARRTNGDATTVFHETYADPDEWADRTVDLSSFAGQTITLGLETKASATGTVAFWGSPTLTGARRSDKPNVIFYVIDGGGADYMSVYGYNRRTTPNLEKLAAEGAVFEHAYSNSSWTKPSTASFMTSLHNSVLGNTTRGPVDSLPPDAITMAERFHRAGYQTAVLTANSNAGTVSGLERGADLLRESEFQNDATSSVDLHKAFWNWRDEAPGQPYWVHFQTTDVHAVGNNRLAMSAGVPVQPFAGLFVSPQDVSTLQEWSQRLRAAGGTRAEAFTKTGISRVSVVTLLQGMFDQQMVHNDYQLGRLVDQLKASGEWAHTMLIVAADHSIASALADMPIELLDPLPPRWTGPMFRPSQTRVPLIVVWPGHIEGGQRFEHAVSLIDVLPTVLDLAGLPMPEVMQGRSLAPLLRGTAGSTPRPVILDEFEADRTTGDLRGRLEVIEGRWGASMWIGPPRLDPGVAGGPPLEPRPWPVLVYDLWNDPMCIAPVNEARPDLVKKYTTFLEETWKDHQLLAKQFTPGAKVALTPEQLERLRALGYIR